MHERNLRDINSNYYNSHYKGLFNLNYLELCSGKKTRNHKIMFYPDLSPMSVKWHLLQNNSSAASRILNCSSAAAAISNLDIFGGHSHSHNHHHQQYNGLHAHAHQRYTSQGNTSAIDKHFDQFGEF